MKASLASLLLLSSTTFAASLPRSNGKGSRAKDPAFTIPALQLDSVVSCVGGIANVTKPFLLVPGTWANATMAYDPGWNEFLTGLGFDVCYVAPPPYMTSDIQLTIQYIANAAHKIYDASQSSFPIMGHSQGGMAISAALTYYPSLRQELSQYFSLAGSLHGTTNVVDVTAETLTTTVRDPAVWQQGPNSLWIKTLRQKGGWYNWIPTTTLFSKTDGTVKPQLNNTIQGSATAIGGKFTGNILVQDTCPDSAVQHNDFLVSNFAYQVVKLAVASEKKYVTPAEVKQAVSSGVIDCAVYFAPNADLVAYNVTLALVSGFASGQPRVIAQEHAEPLLASYITNTKDLEVHDS